MDVPRYETITDTKGYVQMHGNANNNNDNGKQTSPSNDMKILNVPDLRYQPSYAELQNHAFQGDTYDELHDRIPTGGTTESLPSLPLDRLVPITAEQKIRRTKEAVPSVAEKDQVIKPAVEKVEMKEEEENQNTSILNLTVKCWTLLLAVLLLLAMLAVVIYLSKKVNYWALLVAVLLLIAMLAIVIYISKNVKYWKHLLAVLLLIISLAAIIYLSQKEGDEPQGNSLSKFGTCIPLFGTNYVNKLCLLYAIYNVATWQRCSAICFLTPECKKWTWAHPNSTSSPRTCWLRKAECGVEFSSNYISGEKNCSNLSREFSDCVPSYGLEYPGCEMKLKTNVKTWQKCSQICYSTQGCQFWTWFSKQHVSSETCWLKKAICEGKPSAFGVSGDASTYFRCNSLRQ